MAKRVGQKPQTLKPANYKTAKAFDVPKASVHPPQKKELVGVDVFIEWTKQVPSEVGEPMSGLAGEDLQLKFVSNRGQRVWPGPAPATACTDHWRCRFVARDGRRPDTRGIAALLGRVADAGFECIKTENLYEFDGVEGFSGVHGG